MSLLTSMCVTDTSKKLPQTAPDSTDIQIRTAADTTSTFFFFCVTTLFGFKLWVKIRLQDRLLLVVALMDLW